MGGELFKIPNFIYIAKESWKEDCASSNTLKSSLPACRFGTLTSHWIRWFGNIQASQPTKSFIQVFSTKNYLFSSTSANPILDPLP